MNRANRREMLIPLHTAKLVHARMLGYYVTDLARPNWVNVHRLQHLINERTRK